MTGAGTMRLRAVGAVALAVLLALAGCTTTEVPEPVPSPTATDAEPTPSPTGVEPAAVVSLASVDVDGLHVTIAGFVTIVAEDGGACTFEARSEIDGRIVTAESVGIANVGTTSCGTVSVATDGLARGSLTVTLTYRSETTDVTSEPLAVEVP